MTLEKAMDLAGKLLAKARGTNVPEEAAIFAAKAQEVMDRFKLDASDLDFDSNERTRDAEPILDHGYGAERLDEVVYLQAWMTQLATAVCRANDCRMFYVKRALGGHSRERGAVMKIVGRTSDANVARYVYGFLKGEVDRLCRENCPGAPRTFRRHFSLGVVDTISLRLREQRKRTEGQLWKDARGTGNEMAVVRVENAISKRHKHWDALEEFMKRSGRKIHSNTSGVAGSGTTARLLGQVAGEGARMVGKAAGSLGEGTRQIEN